ncbi:hypothetical protein [Variovorax paradoxus]|uniref:hypothetical protein n=1 Tax=Variovorax paradoxus TaxID=34073 RepID=UPI00285C5CDE|nr:hypothetical protein [Variovorax paradoxus]MDR6455507.1 outer membrane murein-binding lipoprotein Lpp [Variovorax paradoxus]
MTLTPLYRVLAVLALLGALLAGGLWYRASLIQDGRDLEAQAAAVRQSLAVASARTKAEAVTAQVTRDLNSRLLQLQNQHDRISSDLSAALADSDHRNQRLDARVARLLDEAAGLRARITSAASGPGGPAGTPPPHQTEPAGDATVADLAESVAQNYEICRRNSERLGAIQEFYEGLRAGRE